MVQLNKQILNKDLEQKVVSSQMIQLIYSLQEHKENSHLEKLMKILDNFIKIYLIKLLEVME